MESFVENENDVRKDQSYQDRFKLVDLPDCYYIEDMYNKQKELQTYLLNLGRTSKFPASIDEVTQKDAELAIYHSFCMDVECEELKVELTKYQNGQSNEMPIAVYFELIDMFFFLFNVGIYTGVDFNKITTALKVLDTVYNIHECSNTAILEDAGIPALYEIKVHILNYIDTLPWKAWKTYDLTKNATNVVAGHYATAMFNLITYAKMYLKLNEQQLYSLYIAKWEENKRRQVDKELGYIK